MRALIIGASIMLAGIVSSVGAAEPTGELPPDSAYCVVKDGHLTINGERVRFWGAIGSFPGKKDVRNGDTYFRQREAVRRIAKVGFNMFRIWHLSYDDKYVKGDGSATDISDFFMAECGKAGIKIWAAGFGGGRVFEDEIDQSAGIIDDPATAPEWQAAMRSMAKEHWSSKTRKQVGLLIPAVAWDPRMEALAIAQMKQKALHVNQHNGLRHADDPTIVVWELTNEQWWMRNMVSGKWKDMPEFFRRSLLIKWHEFLKAKYGTQEKLTAGWGFLLPGENLAQGTILLAPMAKPMKAIELNDTNPQAKAAFETVTDQYSRDDFTRQRGADVLEFLNSLILSHKQRFAAQVKTWGKSCKLSPLIYDTGIGESVASQWLHQHADAVSHAAYMEGLQLEKLDPRHKRYPFYSGLDLAPQLCNDVPWLENNSIEGKPYICYETQYGSPSKYRAEWPSRLIALGSVQDWDAACFHYFTFNNYDLDAQTPFSGIELAKPGPGAFQYDYTSDELEQSQMRVAGAIFRNRLLEPAPKPTVFTYGKPALYDPASMDYAGSYGKVGQDMITTVYRYGMRMKIDPNQKEFVKIDGPVVRFNGYERPNPIRPNDQIEFDYQKGHIRFDAPGVAGYTGFFGQYGVDTLTFANGVTLSDITHNAPEGTAYPPKADERFICFALASEDGKPLDQCSKAVLSLVASSFNTGFKIDEANRKVVSFGKAPVLVTRVGATLTAKQLAGMKYQMIDFDEKVLAEGTVGADGKLVIPNDKPVFLVELGR